MCARHAAGKRGTARHAARKCEVARRAQHPPQGLTSAKTARRRPTANTTVSRHITPPGTLDSERPALGQLSGLFIHNHDPFMPLT